MSKQKIFACHECGLHYDDETTANECEAFCKANKACNIEITKNAIENEAKDDE